MNLIVAPYDAGPTADLVHSTIEDNVLRLSDDEASFFGNFEPNFAHQNQMFVRPVYAPLTALIDLSLIKVSPPINLTTMRNWFVKHLIDRPFDPLEQVRTIFLHSSDVGSFS
jgi:hypothetical protein